MIVEAQKRCTKCGETKPLTEFYWCSKGRGRNKGYNSQCKACEKTRIAKRLAEREGRVYAPMQRHEPTFCEQCGKRIGYGCRHCRKCSGVERRGSKFGAWGKAIADAYSKTATPARKYGAWTERIYSSMTSMRIRDRDKVTRKVRKQPGTWKEAISQAKGKFQQDDRYGIWTRKIRNTFHNWGIKARAEAECRRIARPSASAAVQMRFDW